MGHVFHAGLPHYLGGGVLPGHPVGAEKAAPAVGGVSGQAGAQAGDPGHAVSAGGLGRVPVGGAERTGAGVQSGVLHPAHRGVFLRGGDLSGEGELAAFCDTGGGHCGHSALHRRVRGDPLCDHCASGGFRHLRRYQEEPGRRFRGQHHGGDIDDGAGVHAVHPVFPHGGDGYGVHHAAAAGDAPGGGGGDGTAHGAVFHRSAVSAADDGGVLPVFKSHAVAGVRPCHGGAADPGEAEELRLHLGGGHFVLPQHRL